MPRKAVLSAVQQAALTALPTAEHDLRLHYTLSEHDLAIVRSKRGLHNRLGFAIQLCYLRFPGHPAGRILSMRLGQPEFAGRHVPTVRPAVQPPKS